MQVCYGLLSCHATTRGMMGFDIGLARISSPDEQLRVESATVICNVQQVAAVMWGHSLSLPSRMARNQKDSIVML